MTELILKYAVYKYNYMQSYAKKDKFVEQNHIEKSNVMLEKG